MDNEHTGLYSIGVVSRLTGLHHQTIRQYERLGLITPKRTPGGTRVFSDSDVRRLRSIISLTHDMGVNLAGVEVVLRMRERQEQLISLVREMFSQLDTAARARFESLLRGDEPGLVHRGDTGLMRTERKPAHRRIEIKDEQDRTE